MKSAVSRNLLKACEAALLMFQKGHAIDHFDWGKSGLTADDIRELNEVPIMLRQAIADAKAFPSGNPS